MIKAVFLEYKFGDYDFQVLSRFGANQIVTNIIGLNAQRLNQLKRLGVDLGFSFVAFPDKLCPNSKEAEKRLINDIDRCLEIKADSIWIDNFRWGGDCTDAKVPLHICSQCKGVNQNERLVYLAKKIRETVPSPVKVGYFCVAHKLKVDKWSTEFDFISPMIYQRMFGKPAKYIHEFIKYLSSSTNKPIIPTIAVKDMPDYSIDEIDEKILEQEYNEASRLPSSGVCWFSWDGAVEKNKSDIIRKLWSKTN